MQVASVFTNGGNQAVRIPKSFKLDAREVSIEQDGERLILTPLSRRRSWLLYGESAPRVTADFMAERVTLPHSERNW